MQAQRYNELAQQRYNRIPVYRDVLADLDTPLSAYLKLAAEPYSFLYVNLRGNDVNDTFFVGFHQRIRIKEMQADPHSTQTRDPVPPAMHGDMATPAEAVVTKPSGFLGGHPSQVWVRITRFPAR